jgi:hypothetical protein
VDWRAVVVLGSDKTALDHLSTDHDDPTGTLHHYDASQTTVSHHVTHRPRPDEAGNDVGDVINQPCTSGPVADYRSNLLVGCSGGLEVVGIKHLKLVERTENGG